MLVLSLLPSDKNSNKIKKNDVPICNSGLFLQKVKIGKDPGTQRQQTLISTPNISQPSIANKEDDNVRGIVMLFLICNLLLLMLHFFFGRMLLFKILLQNVDLLLSQGL